MTGRLKSATSLVVEEPVSNQEGRKSMLKMGAMNVMVQKKCRKIVTQKNVPVCRLLRFLPWLLALSSIKLIISCFNNFGLYFDF